MGISTVRTCRTTSIRLLCSAGMFLAMDAALARTADAQPSVIKVPGIVRDFSRNHSDFNVIPIGGYGHYAGNVATVIGVDQKPAFTPGGFRVQTQWRTQASDPLAPHLYTTGGSDVVRLVAGPQINNNPTIDTFDSTQGPYGGPNVGPAPTFVTGSTMPVLTEPTVVPYIADVVYMGNGTTTLITDLHCKTFTLQNNRTLIIDGNLTIVCDETFKIENHTELVIPDGSSLDLYIKKDSVFQNNIDVNVSGATPGAFRIFNLGDMVITIENNAHVYAQIVSPTAHLMVKNTCDFYGTFEGLYVQLENLAGFHIDAQAAADVCGNQLNDQLGAAGVGSTAGISSAATFDEWYSDVLGTNLSQIHTIEMVRNGAGVYQALISDFHPIDDRLFGNEGDPHNYHFTYEITADFTYDACTGQFFEFAGSDDAWLFIDEQLVLDIGGVIPGTIQVIDMDRLMLTDGEVYQMRFFYAQRQVFDSSFNVETNIELQTPLFTASGTAGFD